MGFSISAVSRDAVTAVLNFFSGTLSSTIVVVHLRVFRKLVICMCRHSEYLLAVDSSFSLKFTSCAASFIFLIRQEIVVHVT